MADNERHADDIAQLWGPREETAVEFEAAPMERDLNSTLASGKGSTNGTGNGDGMHLLGSEVPDVARLAEAIASRPLSASRADLDALRSELESTFAQQLAVAIYELMTATNERLATVEEYMSGRLDALGESVDEQVGGVAGSIEAHHRALRQELEAVRSQHAAGVTTVAGDLTALSDRATVMQDEIAALHEVVAGLGETVTDLRRRGLETPWRRRGWNSTP